MITYNKIFVPAAIYVAILFHVVLLFRQMRIASPEELQEPEPDFKYIEAVVVEDPPPVIVELQKIIEPPPEIEPEPPPPIELPPEPDNSAIDVVEEADEVETPPPVNLVTAEESDETGPPYPQQSSAADATTPAGDPVTPEPAEKAFLPFYRVEKRPAFLFRAPLEYPIQAKRQRIEGVVIVEADIDENGIIVETRVVEERGFGLEEAAVEMLNKSRFSPAIVDGRPVAVRMRFTVEFKLR
jgi:periplasmic protein TonB